MSRQRIQDSFTKDRLTVRHIIPEDENYLMQLLQQQMFKKTLQRIFLRQLKHYHLWLLSYVMGWILGNFIGDVALGISVAVCAGPFLVYVIIHVSFHNHKMQRFPDCFKDFYKYWTTNKDRTLYVVTLDGQTVGCCGFVQIDDETAELQRLIIDQKASGQGLGRLMVQHVIDTCRSLGYKHLKLVTTVEQIEARTLYESMGFCVEYTVWEWANTKKKIYYSIKL